MNWDAAVRRYVKMRQQAGYRFAEQGKWLLRFARFADARGDAFMRSETIMESVLDGCSMNFARRRYGAIRKFAQWLAVEDDRHEVPRRHALGRLRNRRPSPYLLTTDQVTAVLHAARDLGVPGSLTGEMYYTLFGLMASTGLRCSEAVGLQRGDVTPDGLVIRDSKFGKSRLVPLSPSVQRHLRAYRRKRLRVAGGSDDLFVLPTGKRPALGTVGPVFRRLLLAEGIRKPDARRGPSLHSLRHSFAVRSLEHCISTDPGEIRRHAYALSVYLGHKDVLSTYWYLEATPTLLRRIAAVAEETRAGEKGS